jgi:hypothetical protein
MIPSALILILVLTGWAIWILIAPETETPEEVAQRAVRTA